MNFVKNTVVSTDKDQDRRRPIKTSKMIAYLRVKTRIVKRENVIIHQIVY